MEKYQNKYRIPSTRATWWDYAACGIYFITICTKERIHHFGKIIDNEMIFSETGQIAHNCWQAIPAHFPFVQLHEFVIMPNHVHGIIVIDKQDVDCGDGDAFGDACRDAKFCVSTNTNTNTNPNKFGPQSKNLASVIRGFKIGVTIEGRKVNPDFGWQPRYHDRIIRDNKEYLRIAQYIDTNPQQWNNDCFYNP